MRRVDHAFASLALGKTSGSGGGWRVQYGIYGASYFESKFVISSVRSTGVIPYVRAANAAALHAHNNFFRAFDAWVGIFFVTHIVHGV